ncbi:MAG: hypothetical protein GY940_29980 [bacterium]|nr:hypothetical protein [bacterium]
MKAGKSNNLMRKTVTQLCLVLIALLPLLVTGCGLYNDRPVILTPETEEGYREPPRRYIMKQRFFTLGEQFVIKDETRDPVFFVKGKVFSIGDKLSFRDMRGRELAYISQKLISLKPKYRIFRDQRLIANVVKKITLLKDKYTINVPGPDDIKVRGNFGDYEYVFTRNGRNIAVVSKKLFAWTDTYGIEIVPGEDDILILASAVVIDMVSHNRHHEYYD